MYKISIIVPVYNAEKYLDKCIKSLMNQTLKEIEIILVNDGSIDESLSICEEYAKKDNKIKILNKVNEGVSSARNLGMKNAIGEYILFVDADDWIEQNLCEYMYHIIKNQEMQICICQHYSHIKDKKINNEVEHVEILNNEECIDKALIPTLFDERKKDVINKKDVLGILYKREFLISNNIEFKEDIKIGEDWLFNIHSFCICSRLCRIKIPLYHYRIIEGSATQKYIKNLDEQFKKVEENIILLINKYITKDNSFYRIHNRIDEIMLNNAVTYFLNETKSYNKINIKKKVYHIDLICQKRIEKINKNKLCLIKKIYRYLMRRNAKYLIYFLSKLINLYKIIF